MSNWIEKLEKSKRKLQKKKRNKKMSDALFKELCESIKEAMQILKDNNAGE